MDRKHQDRGNSNFTRVIQAVAAAVLVSAAPLAAHEPAFQTLTRGQRIESILHRFHAHTHDHAGEAAGRCLQLTQLSILFDAEAGEQQVADRLALLPDSQLAMFVIGSSPWQQTATDGQIQAGRPFTLTYSFVSDGVQINGFGGEPASPSNLFATVNASFPGGMDAFKAVVADRFAHWSQYTSIAYVEVPDDGATFAPATPGLAAGAGVVGRGDIRIAMHPIGGDVLAYNFFPAFGGDMVIDSTKIAQFANATNNFRTLGNVLMHEHGHGLGLAHVVSSDAQFLMEPFLNNNFDGPQEDDIRAVQFLYGDAMEHNDALAENQFLGVQLDHVAHAGPQVFRFEDLALERSNSKDFYGFTVSGSVSGFPTVAVRVEPEGTTYQSAPENGSSTTVNALAARNLGLRVWRRVSANQFSLLAEIDFNPAGEAESMPPINFNIGGFFVAEVFASDNLDQVQRYTLTVANTTIASGQPQMVVANGLEVIEHGVTYDNILASTEVGQTRGASLTIRNFGNAPLEFTNNPRVILSGPHAAEFAADINTASVADSPNALAILGISFTPAAQGLRQATVTIPNNTPDQSEFAFHLAVTATVTPAPAMEVTVDGTLVDHNATFDFGPVLVDEEHVVSFSIRNVGTSQLNVSSLNLGGAGAGDYQVNMLSASLPPNGTVSGTITLNASAEGPRDATLSMINNSSRNPYIVRLTAQAAVPIAFDCNNNGVEDADDIANGTSQDCNGNGIPDECDIADGVSFDCDGNGIPDECESDLDGDGIIDACDNCPLVFNLDQFDSDGNGAGDACEPIEDAGQDDPEPDADAGEDEPAADPDAGDADDDDAQGNPADQPVQDADDAGNGGNGQDDQVDGGLGDRNAAPEVEDDRHLVPMLPTGGCGFGAMSLLPMMIAGLCSVRGQGMRRRTRGRRSR